MTYNFSVFLINLNAQTLYLYNCEVLTIPLKCMKKALVWNIDYVGSLKHLTLGALSFFLCFSRFCCQSLMSKGIQSVS